MITIIEKTKDDLGPKFGLSQPSQRKVYIRKDLPKWIKMSVIVHELYHIDDKSKNVFWREIKAIMSQLFMTFFGGIGCVIMSLSTTRLKFYITRFKNKE